MTQYVTRVVLEVTREEFDLAQAQVAHDTIIALVLQVAETLDGRAYQVGLPASISVGYAKNPAALPEGEGEDGVQSECVDPDCSGCGEDNA